MIDLSLVPIGELIDEIEKRCESSVIAYMHYEDKKRKHEFPVRKRKLVSCDSIISGSSK